MGAKHPRASASHRLTTTNAWRLRVIWKATVHDCGKHSATRALPPPEPAPTHGRTPYPPLLRPSPHNDQCLAPTGDLEGHRARLREAFGNTCASCARASTT